MKEQQLALADADKAPDHRTREMHSAATTRDLRLHRY